MSYTFNSHMALYIEGLIEIKRSLGYKYLSEEYFLHLFDDYWKDKHENEDEITQKSLEEWVVQRATENKTTQGIRISVIRQLSKYINGIGKNAYIPRDKIRKAHPIIYVLNQSEIEELFHVIDAYYPSRPCTYTSRMANEYRIIFRLFLVSGLRRSELVNIKNADVDFDKNSILIRDTKGRDDRIIYILEDMKQLLLEYRHYIDKVTKSTSEWLFPSIELTNHISASGLAERFKKFWELTEASKNCVKKPTLHSLRHTFVVIRMNLWMKNDIDLQIMLPYLSKHLGHKSANETFYYYHHVMDAFHLIREKDRIARSVLPEVRIR